MPQYSAAVSSRRAAPLRTTGPTELPPPLGNWQPLRLVGETALAEVYQARPTSDTAEDAACYALKLLKPEWAEDAGALDLVRREVQAGREVSHPHVISILDWSLSQAPHFLVMPLLSGATLQQRLGRGPLPISQALWIARQTAQGLEGLHAAGWMHADVKPANIFVAEDGHVTLLDLGFARVTGQSGSAADRPVVGTLAYMAPELLTSTLAADIRSDIYSLGITLYQMLSGRLPFESNNALQLAKEHRESVPDRLRTLNPQLPMEVEQLVRQMLAKEPLRRPQTPGDVVEKLVALEIETLAERIPA